MLQLTGGGKDLYLITNPAIIKSTSLLIIIPVRSNGMRSAYVNDKNKVPIKTLSAMGSKKLPIFDD